MGCGNSTLVPAYNIPTHHPGHISLHSDAMSCSDSHSMTGQQSNECKVGSKDDDATALRTDKKADVSTSITKSNSSCLVEDTAISSHTKSGRVDMSASSAPFTPIKSSQLSQQSAMSDYPQNKQQEVSSHSTPSLSSSAGASFHKADTNHGSPSFATPRQIHIQSLSTPSQVVTPAAQANDDMGRGVSSPPPPASKLFLSPSTSSSTSAHSNVLQGSPSTTVSETPHSEIKSKKAEDSFMKLYEESMAANKLMAEALAARKQRQEKRLLEEKQKQSDQSQSLTPPQAKKVGTPLLSLPNAKAKPPPSAAGVAGATSPFTKSSLDSPPIAIDEYQLQVQQRQQQLKQQQEEIVRRQKQIELDRRRDLLSLNEEISRVDQQLIKKKEKESESLDQQQLELQQQDHHKSKYALERVQNDIPRGGVKQSKVSTTTPHIDTSVAYPSESKHTLHNGEIMPKSLQNQESLTENVHFPKLQNSATETRNGLKRHPSNSNLVHNADNRDKSHDDLEKALEKEVQQESLLDLELKRVELRIRALERAAQTQKANRAKAKGGKNSINHQTPRHASQSMLVSHPNQLPPSPTSAIHPTSMK